MSMRKTALADIRILDALATYGPQTANQLAVRVEVTVKTAQEWLAVLEEWEMVAEAGRRSADGRVWGLHQRLGSTN